VAAHLTSTSTGPPGSEGVVNARSCAGYDSRPTPRCSSGAPLATSRAEDEKMGAGVTNADCSVYDRLDARGARRIAAATATQFFAPHCRPRGRGLYCAVIQCCSAPGRAPLSRSRRDAQLAPTLLSLRPRPPALADPDSLDQLATLTSRPQAAAVTTGIADGVGFVHAGKAYTHSNKTHKGLGSSSLIAHVLHYPPPPTRTALY
jgi:hypothetical protein